ncbi:MAG: hypothetical protein QW423_01565 [Candidatus Aenigmatarchaeota archaeon]
MKRSSLLGAVLILLMLSSTFIYYISSLIFQPKLPEGNIIDYELDLNQKNLVLRQGMTLVEFFYGKNCTYCQEKISFLESIVNNYKDKVFLEKILVNGSESKLHFIGFNITENRIYLQEKFLEGDNITEENVMGILCEIMIYPPIECAGV